MSLLIPAYADPRFAAPIAGAYAWVSGLAIDFSAGSGRLVVNVHPDAASAALPPVGQVGVTLGDGAYPSLAALMGDAEFASAFGVIRSKLYSHLKALPAFAGASDVE